MCARGYSPLDRTPNFEEEVKLYLMARTTTLFTSTLFLLLTFFTLSANAQSTRVYVATSGNDSNNCAVQSPCQTVTKALTVVATGGEVVITENGDYDPFVVTKSVTVTAAPGINANIFPDPDSGGAIYIPKTLTAGDVVSIRNLNIKSNVVPASSYGIINVGAGMLSVDGCTITGLIEGIGSGANSQVFIHDTTLRNNNIAIHSSAASVEGLVRLVVDHCHVEQNAYGVYLDPKVLATVRDTVLSGNTTAAIYVFSNKSGMLDDVTVDNCLLSNNNGGLMAYTFNGGSVTARLERNTIVRNSTGVGASYPNTTIYTLQNNLIDANGTNINGSLTPQMSK